METEKGNYKQSLELAQPVLPAFKQSPDGLFVLATDYLKTGDHGAARPCERLDAAGGRAIGLVDASSPCFLRGRCCPEAIDILESVKKNSPPSYELAFNLAGAYQLEKHWARALATYDEALTLDPKSLPALRQAAGHRGAARSTRAVSFLLDAGQKDRTRTIRTIL